MYTTVLVAVLSTTTATPAWGGRFHHCGCSGSIPIAYGYYGSGCCGGWQISYGCNGSGCWGGWVMSNGCYNSACWGSMPYVYGPTNQVGRPVYRSLKTGANGVVRKKKARARYEKISRPVQQDDPQAQQEQTGTRPTAKGQPMQKSRSLAPATLVVKLPADARLTINGNVVPSSSSTRKYVSKPLAPGQKYSFALQAKIAHEDWTMTTKKRVTVRAGEERKVTVKFPALKEVAEE
jgi:uncharacterized protein (TIGR03000 family)